MRKWLLFIAVVVLVLIAALLIVGKRTVLKPPKNVLLITIDTLRADHLGSYGYAGGETSHIDEWAKEGVLFTNATTAVPLTLPSHSTIMTGAYPYDHGVRDNGGFYLDSKWTTLAETLHSNGFATGGFISAFVLDRRWGIAQGFDEYFDNFELSKFKVVSLDSVQRKGEETLQRAFAWLDKNKDHKFFAWIHFYDPHTPYEPPEPFKSEFKGRGLTGMYDGEIAYDDNLVGRIQDYLAKNNLGSTTLVVLLSDHGESFGEHEESGHGFFIYDATVRVPLIIHVPGQEPRQVDDQVRTIDVFPTICDALGIKPPSTVRGASLIPLIRGRSLPRKLLAYSESYYPKFHYGWSELKSLRTPEYKYIDAPERELYRVTEDKGERENLYSHEKARARPFESELAKLLATATSKGEGPKAIDDDSLQKLQALGYIGAYSAPVHNATQGPLPDPKDKIRLYNQIKLAQWNAAEGKTDRAFQRITQVIQEDGRILEAHVVLGNIYLKERKLAEARESFQNALKLNPDYAAGIFGVADTFEDEKNWDAAIAGFRRLIELDPRDPKPYFHLGEIAMDQRDFQTAISNFQKVADLETEQSIAQNRLGACYLEMKSYDEAQRYLNKALRMNARTPNAHFNLGLLYEARENLNMAAEEYRKELSLFPEAYPAHFNLARIRRLQGDRIEERKELETCLAKNPDFGVAYLYLAKNLMDTGDDLSRAKSLTQEGMSKSLEKDQTLLAHYLLADIYNRLGQPGEANAQLKQARAIQQR